MTSNLARYASRDLDRELARAYDGDVPAPYYWQLPLTVPRHHASHHPGEIGTTLPYAALPAQFLLARAVSLEELDELVERRALREEV